MDDLAKALQDLELEEAEYGQMDDLSSDEYDHAKQHDTDSL